MKKGMIVFLFLLFASSACADSSDSSYLNGPSVKKLKRGVINMVTSPVEIPRIVKNHWKDSSAHPMEKLVYFFGGVVKGTAFGIGRLGSGFWDARTFNLEIPDGFEPLMKPDFVWEYNDN